MQTIQRAYKTELKPTKEQVRQLRQHCHAVRKAYNWMLDYSEEAYRRQRSRRSRCEEQGAECKDCAAPMCGFVKDNELRNAWRVVRDREPLGDDEDFRWTREVSQSCLEVAQRNLRDAYNRYFAMLRGELPRPPANGRRKDGKPPGYPRRHKYRDANSVAFWGYNWTRKRDSGAEVPPTYRVEKRRIQFRGIGWVKLKERGFIPNTPDAPGDLKIMSATVSRIADRWYVSVQVEQPAPTPSARREQVLGIDRNCGKMLAQNGPLGSSPDARRGYENPKALYREERKLRRLKHEFARRHCVFRRQQGETEEHAQARKDRWSKSRNLKKRGDPLSANARKTADKMAKCEARIARIRRNAVHQATHRIIEHARPAALGLETLSIVGMLRSKRQSKAVSDAAMGEAGRQLEYKAAWGGTQVVNADRWFASTRTCPACGHKNEFGLGVRKPTCTECGYTGDRDLDWAAVNLAALAGKPSESPSASGGAGS